MPRLVDHDRRRAELAEAVWRIVSRQGVAAASVRGVAAEAGLSKGSVRFFFADQDELLHFAMTEVVRRVRARAASQLGDRSDLVEAGEPVEAALQLLDQVLPVSEERRTEARVWLAFVTHDAGDATAQEIRRQLDDEVRRLCEHCIASLAELGALGAGRDPAAEASALWALLDGLTLQLLGPITPEAALATLRTYLRQLAAPAPA
jgi:AcrR family transcriptional regulator